MGDINTNIRIDELEKSIDSLNDNVDAIPSFYKIKDHAHSDDIEESEYNEIKNAIESGKIILTGKFTRTGAQDYTFAENVPVTWSKVSDDMIQLGTTCNIAGSGTNRILVPMFISFEYVTNTVIRLYFRPAYEVT